MSKVINLDLLKRQNPAGMLGLTLDGSRLDGVALRRTNGALLVQQSFSISLSLDPLTNDPELVGREIRNRLDTLGVRERQCALGLPLKWALTAHVEVPEMPEADVAGFLQIEAERGFPCDTQTLQVAVSQAQAAAGKRYATLVGIPKNHLAAVEQVLRAAKLKPVSFGLGVAALQPPALDTSNGVVALAIGESHIGLQVTVNGGAVALRALEGALETVGSQRVLQADLVAREVRITLGQLPGDLRETVRRIRVFGPSNLARQLADELELRLEASGLEVETVGCYAANEFGVQLPANAVVSAALSLAAERLVRRRAPLEFLLPKLTPLQQIVTRYSSGKLRTLISAAAAVALIAGGLFFFQQCQLWRLESQWARMQPTIRQLTGLQEQIRQYRPWYDESVGGLTILRSLTEAFPEDGSVTAKTVEIRDLSTVTCTGTARNYQALLKAVEKLRNIPQIPEVNLGPTRGQSPALQFTFNFQWSQGGRNAN